MTVAMTVLLLAFVSYLTAYVLYQTLLFAGNAFIREQPYTKPSRLRRINVFVPAHNEELLLPRLLSSLDGQNYPKAFYRVTVIADNCSDGTVAAARRFDVDVLERTDHERRGKGYAIGWALDRIDAQKFDAMAIVDGDSIVAPEFLEHLNLQMDRGDRVIQCYNGVANPGYSWFTRLMNVSRTIANEIIHPGKRKLGLSSHLMGNGMCFDLQVLRSLKWTAFSVGEDWEYYARLILGGVHVGYSRQSRVYHQESAGFRQASSQRMRWSGSRFQVLRRFGPALLFKGLRTGSVQCLDASLPLVFPNPSLGMNLTLLGLALAGALWGLTSSAPGLVVLFAVLAVLQLSMFLIGVLYTENRAASALSLFLAPAFLAWKMGIDILSLFGAGTKHWKPTARRAS
jgi:1,2-diacylglycerol 3-beta-glucosyltransferase